jgi:hypothetical protein
MPETPRFLISQKRFDDARKVFARIAKINGSRVNTRTFLFENEIENEIVETPK